MTAAEAAARPGGWIAALEAISARELSRLVALPVRASLILIVLVLALDLAGNVLLPPLDRTEVIYAQTAKQMLEADGPGWGSWTAPAFQAEPKFEKPLAVLWLQAATAWASLQVDQIRGYRIPSILGTILGVLFTCWGAARLFDARVAFVGAGLLATMLVITLQATLAMPEALMLAATCAALLAMGRAYVASRDEAVGRGNAFVFWTALGVGVLVNVITIPLIGALTALTLIAWDGGKATWVKRLWSLAGVIVFVTLAALWPLMLWLGGTLETALAQWREEGLHLLLGPQEMKWRVLPGLFVIFLLLGMFPAGLFLGPALATAWRERSTPAIRFMIAWIVPYLLFLELFTRKTPLYMVQAMLPPFAVIFAVWVVRWKDAGPAINSDVKISSDVEPDAIHQQRWFRLGSFGWLALVAGLVMALWVLPFLLKLTVSPIAILLGMATLALAVIATKAMLEGHRLAAAASLVAMAVAFSNLTVPVTFAGLRPVWVATEVRAAIDGLRACKPGGVALGGFSEPSGVFELSLAEAGKPDPEAIYRVWSTSAFEDFQRFLQHVKIRPPGAVACVAAYDFIHACSHRFTIWASGQPAEFQRCPPPARFRCENVPGTPMIGRMCK